tara:strand:+ start:310 stop:1374 length:1065 start_codon:yes stop_codon:yes gene_type:complete
MGINGLTSLLKKVSPNSIKVKKLYDYTGKTIAIDTSLFMHKFMYSYGNLISGFFDQIYHLRRRGITPIYIFDGKPPVEKDKVLKCRKNAKEKLNTRINDLQSKLVELNNIQIASISTTTQEPHEIKEGEIKPVITLENIEKEKTEISNKIKKLSRHAIKITRDDFNNVKKLFNLLNIMYYNAEGEADTLCVNLIKNNLADACMTEDMDFLTHGCSHLIRDFSPKSNVITEYNLSTMLSDLNFSQEQFIDMCILCGCDYTCKIKGLGPIGALKLIKQHNNIETIIDKLCGEDKKYTLPEDFNFTNARELFNQSNNSLNYKSFHAKEVKLNELNDFLKTHTKLSPKQINNRFKKLF